MSSAAPPASSATQVGQTGNHSLLWYGLNVEVGRALRGGRWTPAGRGCRAQCPRVPVPTSADTHTPAPAHPLLQDPAVQKPSPNEVEHPEQTKNTRLMRDRHTVLPLGALRDMLQRVAAAGRDRGRYLAQRAAGRHYVELHPGGVLKPKCGPQNPGNPACTMKAPAPEPPYVPREQREAEAAAAAAAAAQQQAEAEAAAAQWGQAFAPVAPLQAGPWSSIGLRERPPASALLGAALLLLAAAAVGRSLTGSRKRRQPPHIVSLAAPGLPGDEPPADAGANGHPHA